MTLTARGASLRFGPATVLEEVSLDVVPGVVTALVGPNGAGKSSLVRLLAGEMAPARGEIRLDGTPLGRLDPSQQATRRSVMGQSADIVFDFRVEEVLRMGWVRGGPDDLARTTRELARHGAIDHLLPRRFRTLSGGERQRVQLVRALLQVWCLDGEAPRYLLLDEPTSSLDLSHELLALRLVRRAARRRIGVLVVLHDLNLAARFADRVVLLADGAVRSEGPPDVVFRDAALTNAYGTRIQVERHETLGRLVVHT